MVISCSRAVCMWDRLEGEMWAKTGRLNSDDLFKQSSLDGSSLNGLFGKDLKV